MILRVDPCHWIQHNVGLFWFLMINAVLIANF